MAEKGSRDTKQDGHDFNPRTGLVVWKVLYSQILTSIKQTPHRNSFSYESFRVIRNTSKLRANGFGFIKPDNGIDLRVWRISFCPYTPQVVCIHAHVMQANNKLRTAHTYSQTLRTAPHTHTVRFKNMRGGNVCRWWERFLSHTWQGQQTCLHLN